MLFFRTRAIGTSQEIVTSTTARKQMLLFKARSSHHSHVPSVPGLLFWPGLVPVASNAGSIPQSGQWLGLFENGPVTAWGIILKLSKKAIHSWRHTNCSKLWRFEIWLTQLSMSIKKQFYSEYQTLEYQTFWSMDFQRFSFEMVDDSNSFSYGPDHSETKPLKIWTKWWPVCSDFQWF